MEAPKKPLPCPSKEAQRQDKNQPPTLEEQ